MRKSTRSTCLVEYSSFRPLRICFAFIMEKTNLLREANAHRKTCYSEHKLLSCRILRQSFDIGMSIIFQQKEQPNNFLS